MKRITRTAVAFLAAGTLIAAAPSQSVPSRPDDKTIVHVLNRLGFGARPGDIARVRAIGLAAYIDQQLHPERIGDTGMAARLAGFETINKSTRELAEDYFGPAMEARRRAQQAQRNQPSMDEAPGAQGKPRSREQMQAMRKVREVLMEQSEQKILRAAYSERQLEEVLTDFWFNHFICAALLSTVTRYRSAWAIAASARGAITL